MAREAPWQNLRSVMIVTMYVAVILYVVRTTTPTSDDPSVFLFWVPFSLMLAVFFCWPVGRAFGRAFQQPGPGMVGQVCPNCEKTTLRPLLRAGGRLSDPAVGSRCLVCGMTYRAVGGVMVEEASGDKSEAFDGWSVRFLDDELAERSPESEQAPEIRFLDDRPV